VEVPVLEAAKSFDWFNAPLLPEEQAVAGQLPTNKFVGLSLKLLATLGWLTTSRWFP
jgi:hypothetical protein